MRALEYRSWIRVAIVALAPRYGLTDPGVVLDLVKAAVRRFEDPSQPVPPLLAAWAPLLGEAADQVIHEVDAGSSQRFGIGLKPLERKATR